MGRRPCKYQTIILVYRTYRKFCYASLVNEYVYAANRLQKMQIHVKIKRTRSRLGYISLGRKPIVGARLM